MTPHKSELSRPLFAGNVRSQCGECWKVSFPSFASALMAAAENKKKRLSPLSRKCHLAASGDFSLARNIMICNWGVCPWEKKKKEEEESNKVSFPTKAISQSGSIN